MSHVLRVHLFTSTLTFLADVDIRRDDYQQAWVALC